MKVGDILIGFFGGMFGKFECGGTIEGFGEDWVVVRHEDGEPLFGHFSDGWRRDLLDKMKNAEEEAISSLGEYGEIWKRA